MKNRDNKGRFVKGHHQLHSEETKRKISKSIEEDWKINRNNYNERCKKISKAHKGKHRSEEYKRKLGERMKGNKINLGRKHTEEFKIKRSGKNSLFWKGGISFEPYGIEFNNKLKEFIRKRDNYRCQECFRHQDELFRNTKAGMRKCKLYVHHIDFNKQNNNPNNLISLCLNCHAQTQMNREDWTNYFQDKIGGEENSNSIS